MKKLLSLLLLTATTLCGFSQEVKIDYLRKSRHQKTAAWIFLGSGVLSSGIGSVQTNPDYGSSSNNTGFLIAGLAAIGASIPLFISSAHNKHKGASIALENEPVPEVQSGNVLYHGSPLLTLRIRL